MALADYYRVLGLRTGASFSDIKLAYRNLARLYHPDVNPGDQRAKEKFIQVTQAYRTLLESRPQDVARRREGRQRAQGAPPAQADLQPNPKPAGNRFEGKEEICDRTHPAPVQSVSAPVVRSAPGASPSDQQLKLVNFGKLRDLFQSSRFPRAVALVEGLATRFPNDPEVRQWHAITYYRWGHDLLGQGNSQKAMACLKKALRLDPQNKSLRLAVEKDMQKLEKLQAIPVAQA